MNSAPCAAGCWKSMRNVPSMPSALRRSRIGLGKCSVKSLKCPRTDSSGAPSLSAARLTKRSTSASPPSTAADLRHSGSTSSGFRLRCAKMERFCLAFSLALCHANSICLAGSPNRSSCDCALMASPLRSRTAFSSACVSLPSSSGMGTKTPSSLRMLSALRRMTRSTAPSTGLSSPYSMVLRTSRAFWPKRSTRPSRCSWRVGFQLRS
ncbi:hypothetical protein D9M70_500770 [compost metagenome]